ELGVSQRTVPGQIHLPLRQGFVQPVVGGVQDEFNRHTVLGEVVAHAAEDVYGFGAVRDRPDREAGLTALRALLGVRGLDRSLFVRDDRDRQEQSGRQRGKRQTHGTNSFERANSWVVMNARFYPFSRTAVLRTAAKQLRARPPQAPLR